MTFQMVHAGAMIWDEHQPGRLIPGDFSIDVETDCVRLSVCAEFLADRTEGLEIESLHPVLGAVLPLYRWSVIAWNVWVEIERGPIGVNPIGDGRGLVKVVFLGERLPDLRALADGERRMEEAR